MPHNNIKTRMSSTTIPDLQAELALAFDSFAVVVGATSSAGEEKMQAVLDGALVVFKELADEARNCDAMMRLINDLGLNPERGPRTSGRDKTKGLKEKETEKEKEKDKEKKKEKKKEKRHREHSSHSRKTARGADP